MPLTTLSFQSIPNALFRPVALALFLLWATIPTLALPAPGVTSQSTPLSGNARAVIERFLLSQTAGLSGKVAISINAPMLEALPPCAALEPFLPSGERLWGRVSVGLRCNADQPWTRYLSTHIAVVDTYYVAAHLINAGQALTLADIQMREGDLTCLPDGVVVDPAQLSGVIASKRIAPGAPIRRGLLQAVALVLRGQTVKVITTGAGFVVSTEGKAMTNAAAGEMIQVRIQGGRLLSGIVRPDGMVQRPL